MATQMDLITGYNDWLTDYFFAFISKFSQLKCQKGEIEAINNYHKIDFNAIPVRIPTEGLPIEVSRGRHKGFLMLRGFAISLDSNKDYSQDLNEGLKIRATMCVNDIEKEFNGKGKVIISCKVICGKDLINQLLHIRIICSWRYCVDTKSQKE